MHFVVSFLRKVPLLGWFIRDAQRGGDANKICFFVNLVMIWAIAIYMLGYPALILPALMAVPIMFAILITITAADLFRKTD